MEGAMSKQTIIGLSGNGAASVASAIKGDTIVRLVFGKLSNGVAVTWVPLPCPAEHVVTIEPRRPSVFADDGTIYGWYEAKKRWEQVNVAAALALAEEKRSARARAAAEAAKGRKRRPDPAPEPPATVLVHL